MLLLNGKKLSGDVIIVAGPAEGTEDECVIKVMELVLEYWIRHSEEFPLLNPWIIST